MKSISRNLPNPEVTRSGFTWIECLVVVAVLGVLAAVLVPVVGKMRESARRAACAENLRVIGNAALHYAEEWDGRFPRMDPGGRWPWDVSVNVTYALSPYGTIRDTFYCPSGPFDERAVLWDHGVSFTRGGERGSRTISYVLLFERAPRVLPQYTHSRLPATGSGGEAVGPQELAVDAVLSAGGGRHANFHRIIHGSMPRPDRTNHLNGTQPAGGNVLFLDGHVAWRDFEEMDETKVTGVPVFWW